MSDRAIVLVHGAWHGAWCWERVLPMLDAAGVDATAVDLPSRGNPSGDLAADAAHVGSVLDTATGEVVLVGHSYGGGVVTEAGEHPAVAHLVYLCAFALDKGESPMSAAADESEAAGISHDGRPDAAAALVIAEDGTTTISADAATELFYNRCDDQTARWAASQLVAQPMGSLQSTVSTVAWRSRPSTYAVCTDDNIVHPELQRILAARCTNAVDWATDHSPFLSAPELVAQLLTELAQAPG